MKMHTFQSPQLNCIKMEFNHSPQSMFTPFPYNPKQSQLYIYYSINRLRLWFCAVNLILYSEGPLRKLQFFSSEGRCVIRHVYQCNLRTFFSQLYPLSSTNSNWSLKICPLSLCLALILFLFQPFQATGSFYDHNGGLRTKNI